MSLTEIAQAAFALQAECRKEGHPNASVAIAWERITNGVVTINVFQSAIPQIIISGVRYFSPTNSAEIPAYSPPIAAMQNPAPALAVTNAPPPTPPPPYHPPKPATPKQIAAAEKRLAQEMARLDVEENDHRIHVVSTNAGPGYDIEHYVVFGNTVLTPQMIAATLTNIDGAFGTNVSFVGVKTVVEQLQQAYHNRGYVTVSVVVPKQTLTNATVKLQVLEGRLENVTVVGNHYFSSNNVMASLPSLHANTVLNGPVFNAELARANLNQDRQIYPVIGPGTNFGESQLTLTVKDRVPLHAKVELNNQNSPGTPDLRVNSSAVYDNLWQEENSLGLQYGFSPEEYKQRPQWEFYDKPVVADYSAFYRLPLGSPRSLEDQITTSPGSFGYNEATRQFNVPPPSATPDFTIFASRATIDTGLGTIPGVNSTSISTNGTTVTQETLNQNTVHEDITVNDDIGGRLSIPFQPSANFSWNLTVGLDYKEYQVTSYETNVFSVNGEEIDYDTHPPTNAPINFTDYSPVPTTGKELDYLPLSLRYDANLRDSMGTWAFGVGLNANLWFSSAYSTTSSSTIISTNSSGKVTTNNVTTTTYIRGARGLQQITGSGDSSGHWVTITPSISRDLTIDNWTTLVRGDGQWASEPLISSEQFGAGGVNSVRGYHEGEVFGDAGWHVSFEEQTPPHVIGTIYDGAPLTIRGSVYMDYADVYLLHPPAGVAGTTSLWSTGFGLSASAGSHWEAQFLFSWPLISTSTTPAYDPVFDFALTAQF